MQQILDFLVGSGFGAALAGAVSAVLVKRFKGIAAEVVDAAIGELKKELDLWLAPKLVLPDVKTVTVVPLPPLRSDKVI
jgi:hypothetical protein